MKKYVFFFLVLMVSLVLAAPSVHAQMSTETILDMNVLQSLIDETSGALQMHHLMELGGYPRDRQADEYADTYYETQYIVDRATQYGFSDVRVERWQAREPLWDGEVGELWMIEPEERLVISYRDITTALAPNSSSGEWTGNLVFINDGNKDSDYEGKDIEGNFVLTSGSPRRMYNLAVKKYKAAGIISYSVINNPFEVPDKIAWNSLPTNRGFFGMDQQDTPPPPEAFGFNISPRMGDVLRRQLSGGQNIVMKAIVRATERDVDNELVTALIPGDGTSDEEIVFTAHLFEGVHKQGACDNVSGCASILEAGRVLIKLIDEGKISRPARSMRFLWIPEISGTFLYLIRFPEETKKMMAAINLDMVGEDVHKNLNCLRLYQNLKSRVHCIDDIGVALFEWMGWMSQGDRPVTDPMGTQTPFYYDIMPYSSGSDHIVFQMKEFKIPISFFNNWPDMAYHTSRDRPDMADATQLKRSAILTAGMAIALGGGEEADIVRIGSRCLGRALGRLHQKSADELGILTSSNDSVLVERYRDARYIVQAQIGFERRSLESLYGLTPKESSADGYVTKLIKELDNTDATALRTLDAAYRSLCARRNIRYVSPSRSNLEKELARLTPADVPKDPPTEEDGEIDLWALFMGPRIQVEGIDRFQGMELRYFVDGKRSLLDIRNAVSAEFGPVPMEAVKAYFEQLEEKGYVTLKKK